MEGVEEGGSRDKVERIVGGERGGTVRKPGSGGGRLASGAPAAAAPVPVLAPERVADAPLLPEEVVDPVAVRGNLEPGVVVQRNGDGLDQELRRARVEALDVGVLQGGQRGNSLVRVEMEQLPEQVTGFGRRRGEPVGQVLAP